MPVNKDPFFRSFSKDGVETVFPGKVQAGATQAIKKGEICCFNKTAGYWVPVSAVADAAYPLAIAKVEQKATDLERYMEFYGLHPEDEFEFPMNAARALALGDTFTLTASDSQTLTYTAAGFPVAVCVHDGNYPEAGTTIRNQSSVVVRFLENVSWWGYMQSLAATPRPQTIVTADNLTLRPDQCFGSVVYVSAAKTITLPPARPGMHLFVQVTAAAIAGVDPDDGDRIILSGTALDDGDKISSAEAAGDFVELRYDSAAGWATWGMSGVWTDGG